LCSLLNGQFFKDLTVNKHHGRMSENDWVQLGVDMSKIKAPVSWGRYPRNIEKHIKSFKAEELSNFLVHYLLPLLFGRADCATFRALQHVVFFVSVATSYEIKMKEVEEAKEQLIGFTRWYYDTFYGGNPERLPACKYTIHGMLHLIEDI